MPPKKLNEEQRTLVRGIVLWLSRKYYRWVRNGGSTLNQLVSERFLPASEDELASLFDKPQVDISEIRKFVFFAPPEIENSLLPVASIRCDFRKRVPEVRVQVGLFTLLNDKPVAIGLRFETPEGTGAHNYYHCQFFKGYVVASGDFTLPGDMWLPTQNPTLLLAAKNAVLLMICMVASLYGRLEVQSLSVEPFGNQLKRYMKLVPWVESEEAGTHHHADEQGRWHRTV